MPAKAAHSVMRQSVRALVTVSCAARPSNLGALKTMNIVTTASVGPRIGSVSTPKPLISARPKPKGQPPDQRCRQQLDKAEEPDAGVVPAPVGADRLHTTPHTRAERTVMPRCPMCEGDTTKFATGSFRCSTGEVGLSGVGFYKVATVSRPHEPVIAIPKLHHAKICACGVGRSGIEEAPFTQSIFYTLRMCNQEECVEGPHPRLTRRHPRLTRRHPRLTRPHPRLTRRHPRLISRHPRLTRRHPHSFGIHKAS